MNQEITLTDVGPIEGTFSIDLSPGPGVYEFRGARGTGKTTLISSIDWIAGHKVDVTLHDGALSGKAEGFGVIAPVGGRKRRKGELPMDTIDAEKFSLTDLVDPPGKTPEVRDAHAIKALAVLSEAQADPSLYYELAGGQAEYDALGVQETDDPVLLAKRVKDAYDKEARQKQRTAEAEAKHAAPLEYVPEGLDINASSDLDALAAERDEARDTLQALKADREHGLQAEREAEAAKERLDKIRSEYTGPTVEAAEKQLSDAEAARNTAQTTVEELERKLRDAKAELQQRRTQYDAAHQAVDAARSHADAIAALEDTASASPSYPSEADIQTAHADVQTATKAYDQGLRIRDVKQNHAKAQSHREAAKKAEQAAAEAKNKAAEVFDRLAQSLHTKHLQIRTVDGAPRLFVEHPRRGRTAFDRVNGLSDGERVDFALRELLPHIESPGLLPIPQRIWQDLQPTDRKRLHELAVEKELYLFGAQVDDGELRVTYLGEDQ